MVNALGWLLSGSTTSNYVNFLGFVGMFHMKTKVQAYPGLHLAVSLWGLLN